VLACDLEVHSAPRFAVLAFAVRHLDAAGQTVSNEDFDALGYVRDWVLASKTNRAFRTRSGLVQVRRKLNPPPAAVALRIGLYVPGSGYTFKPLLRNAPNTLRLPPQRAPVDLGTDGSAVRAQEAADVAGSAAKADARTPRREPEDTDSSGPP
jgi:hypothetical protein